MRTCACSRVSKVRSVENSVTLTLGSKALTVSGLADASLAAKSVAVTGAVYDYALASVPTTRALGNIRVGATANLSVGNTTATSADFQDRLAVAATSSATGRLTDTKQSVAAGAACCIVFAR